jgi:hypothetical protein
MLDVIRPGSEARPAPRERDMAGDTTGDPATYEIRIRSELDDGWSDWFTGLRRVSRHAGDTVLVGSLDQPALHAVLRRIRDLGLTLVSVRRVEQHDTPTCAENSSLEDPT